MVKFRSKKPRRFGMPGGIHCTRRKEKFRHKFEYKTPHPLRKKNIDRKWNKLKVYRVNTLRKYNIMKYRSKYTNRRLFISPNEQLYTIQRVSADTPFKFSLKRVSSDSVDGYRLVNLKLLQAHISEISMHVATCLKAQELVMNNVDPIKLVTEVKTLGLASVLQTQCQGCKKIMTFETSPPLKNDTTKSYHYDVNVRAVWGSMVTGSGGSHLNELMATLNSPGMSEQTFTKIEQEIGDLWENTSNEELLAAGAEELRIAIEKGNYHDGVPCITVICDGGWCKRSHKHTYNALGGVAIIIGAETGELLHIGVRNKYCCICDQAEYNNTNPKPHRCFRNWKDSSQAMESDIILEGFLRAESTHGLRYTRVIADGDSSVFAKIQECVPIWGKDVKKIECSNHVCKCLRSNLEKLVEENPCYKGKNKLTKAVRIRLTSAVRCAIRLRSKESERKKGEKLLEHDIRNSIYHIMGKHDRCSDFCKARSETSKEKEIVNVGNEVDDNIPDIIQGISDIWSETTSVEAEEESRGDTPYETSIDQMIIRDINVLLDRVAAKSSRLMGNSTTNLAESWMNKRMKFDGGKLFNRCNRGSWQTRCFGACLRKNLGPQWSSKVWLTTTSSKPGLFFDTLYKRRDQKLSRCKKYQEKPESKSKRYKRKMERSKESTSKKARMEYGAEALDSSPGLTATELEDKKKAFLDKHIDLSEEKLKFIEKSTREQSLSTVWLDERRKRLTASNFATIVKRNPSINVRKLVQSLLYSKFKGNLHTRRGLQEENMTVKEYIAKKKQEGKCIQVSKVGLVISREHKFLAASPDGKVVEDGVEGVIEIKNLLHSQPLNLTEAAKEKKTFCLEYLSNELKLKRNHQYYYQVQGQMNIANVPWADFIVRTVNPYEFHIERIEIDVRLWKEVMLPKLTAFYFKVLLPELASPRCNTLTGIREPGVWYEKKSSKTSRRVKADTDNSVIETAVKDQLSTPGTSSSHYSSVQDTQDRSSSSSSVDTRSKRHIKVKFVGRRISHEWIEDEASNTKKWYVGTVLGTLSGRDGDRSAVYEILYDGDDKPYSVDHLVDDFISSSVKFVDI